MISKLLLATTTATTLCFAACANAQEVKGEVIHQWTSAAESAGVKVLAQKFTELGGTWVDNAISGGPNAASTTVLGEACSASGCEASGTSNRQP